MIDVSIRENDEYFMREALKEAVKAETIAEVPIGAVVVIDGKIISRAHNLRETKQNAVAHAELLAIDQACRNLGTWRLENATLYVTLEPCAMCSGAIILSRVERVVYGAKDPKGGCAGSFMNLLDDSRFNHQSEVVSGVLEAECADLLSSFFRHIRVRKKQEKQDRNEIELAGDTGIDRG
ncbi:tRNA adenosine(34) deaminase TadA [Bacillus canaveralius]|uniref:tRNA-specific adenosine deaminase n=1 Tax=Bacillus canaveralius TaxID=1403243 RepID=A0A2N5GHH1_9BACI|nr:MULTISPECIES: tRNA adenosine(34) deaminase TadA [Bacillus]PLR80197.1 tRNA adenosine(34) deaminase TadA [Bacillus canaveralius]PLR81954.1 tRNA adenosine(34) deaminase TadA [Bacillus sp. V33-4]PLR88140.1 tRNA adenosine(34) deaminase TadA [Bacillus canaveralius]RSK46898.1 tRNA adenosine(34) deaminase TadA [Bacillus canaveralius]